MNMGSRLILSAFVGVACGKELVAMDKWIRTGKPITVVDLMLEGAEVQVRNCGDVDDALTVESMSFDRQRLTVDVAGVLSRDVTGGKVVAEASMVSASNGASMSERVAHRLMLMASGRHKREQTLCAHLSRTMPHSACSLRMGKVEIPFDFNRIPSKVFAGNYSIRTRVADERGKPIMCFEASLLIPRGPSGEVLRQLHGHTAPDCERLRQLADSSTQRAGVPKFFECGYEKCPDIMKVYHEEFEPRMEDEEFRAGWSHDGNFVAEMMKGKEEGMKCLCKSCETMASEWAPSQTVCKRFIDESGQTGTPNPKAEKPKTPKFFECGYEKCPDIMKVYHEEFEPRMEDEEFRARWSHDVDFVAETLKGNEEGIRCLCNSCETMASEWAPGQGVCGRFMGESYNHCSTTYCPDGKVWYEHNLQPRFEKNPELAASWGSDIEFVKNIIQDTRGEEVVECVCNKCHSSLVHVWPVGRDVCSIYGQKNRDDVYDACRQEADNAQPIASLRLVTVLVGSMIVMMFHECGPRPRA